MGEKVVVFCFPPVLYCIMLGDHAVQRYGSETVREQLVSAWFSRSHSVFLEQISSIASCTLYSPNNRSFTSVSLVYNHLSSEGKVVHNVHIWAKGTL